MLDDPDKEVERWRWIDISKGLPEDIRNNLHVPIDRNILMQTMGLDKDVVEKSKKVRVFKSDKMHQIVYGVVLAPDEVDFQDDYMVMEDIEKAAHDYLIKSRIVGKQHEEKNDADVVESYIAPQDMEFDGQNGPQKVKKGSWIIGIKVNDPKEWEKILDGSYTGFSVGGVGERE